MSNEYTMIARSALENFIQKNIVINVPDEVSNDLLMKRKGVFVTILKNSELRGCIGTIFPIQDNTALEIIHNSISSGTKDHRFPRVTENELSDLKYQVYLLEDPEIVSGIEMLDHKKYGVIVSNKYSKGLLLPDLEGVNSVDEQINIALMKARISSTEEYQIERFEVIKYFE